MNRLSVVATLAVSMAACGDGNRMTTPLAPSVLPPSPTFTVSGTVVGNGGSPIEGVKVFVAGRHGTTDGSGQYTLLDVPRSYGGALFTKPGYAAAREILTVSGDTRFDVRLGPPIANDTLSGVVYEVTPWGLMPLNDVLVHEYSCEKLLPAPPFFPGSSCLSVIAQTTRTDALGRYRFTGLYAGNDNTIGVEGPFRSADSPDSLEAHEQTVRIAGDTRLDLQLVRR